MWRRPRDRVILGPRKNKVQVTANSSQEVVLNSLKVPPSNRTQQDIDIILGYITKWPDFVKYIHSDQELREICRRLECEEYRPNQLIFKEGQRPDGWYLLFSGQCTLYAFSPNDTFHDQIPSSHLSHLRAYFGQDKCFKMRKKITPKMQFGYSSLISNELRTFSVYVDVSSILLRVDPWIYQTTNDWFAKAQLEKKANLISQVPQFNFLRELSSESIYSRLAECMIEKKYDAGTIITATNQADREHGFMIIEEGLIAHLRMVDFNGYKLPKQRAMGEMSISIPKGKQNIPVKTLGPKSMIPHPSMTEYIVHPFSLQVIEPVICYELMTEDLPTMLLNSQIQQLKLIVSCEPEDDQVIRHWANRQEEEQWTVYKKKCVKDARRKARIERDMAGGQWVIRKATVPKAMKSSSQLTSSIIRQKKV